MTASPPDGLPEDDALISYIESQPTPPKVKEIAKAFRLPMELRAPLRSRLKQLAEDGKIKSVEGRRVTGPDHLPPVAMVEITAITDDGDAIAHPVDASEGTAHEILVVPDRRRSGKTVAVGDRALVRLTLIGPSQYEAQVIRKMDRHRQQVFGQVFKSRDGYGLEPVERGARSGMTLLPPDDNMPFRAGDMIEAEVVKGSGYGRKTAKAIRNLGPADDHGAFAALAIAEFELRHVFPDDALKVARAAGKPTLGDRHDLRSTPLVTIDGADAKDFDDAVFAEPRDDGGYRMIVAIADVAHYVAPDGPLDREAQQRGNSVYLPDFVIPMLPEELSNGLCSLVPGEDRACLAVEMIIDASGNKTGHKFFRGLMRSHARLTYDAVEDYRRGIDTEPAAGLDTHHLDHLLAAYELRANVRAERGALDLDLPEKRVQFDDNGVAVAITKKHQSISQKLIEEFMILANVAAAETLEGANALCVFRAHEPPDPSKVDGLRDVVTTMGIPFPKGQVIQSRHFNSLLHQAKSLGDEAARALLNETVLRCQSQADYRITNPGHFGLALRRYAHFTSPIRRYADLMVHRSLINHIKAETIALPAPDNAAEIAQAISDTERRAAQAERRTVDRYATKLVEQDTGKIVEGRVTTITGFGAFVQIGDTGAEGLLPLGRLPDDYYEVDTTAAVISGRKSGVKIRTGDIIDVMILEVSALKASVVLGWADGGTLSPGRKGGGRKRGDRKGGGKKPGPNGGRDRSRDKNRPKKAKSTGNSGKKSASTRKSRKK
ncbi:MAG: VacB/RNase II family 3'-5' exoribonuclease [Alphaproteobacteria bacterium]|nr:VacB/RNase II family 3'-5' exoribonuclease [Alphaproteobacteria bacterium]